MNTDTNRNQKIARSLVPFALLALAAVFLGGCQDPEPTDPAALIPDWRTYYNQEVGVEFKYPYTLKLDVDTAVEGQLVAKLLWVGRESEVFKLETRDGETAATGGVIVGGSSGSESTVEVDGEELRQIEVAWDGRTFVFIGKGSTFDKVLDSVNFIE
jgi:hypothetical protein